MSVRNSQKAKLETLRVSTMCPYTVAKAVKIVHSSPLYRMPCGVSVCRTLQRSESFLLANDRLNWLQYTFVWYYYNEKCFKKELNNTNIKQFFFKLLHGCEDQENSGFVKNAGSSLLQFVVTRWKFGIYKRTKGLFNSLHRFDFSHFHL